MSTPILPSEHYRQTAKTIVKQLFPNATVAENHEKVMYVWRTIMEAVLDAPAKGGNQ